MTRFWYDFEFLEDGSTIDPISIGVVDEDGSTYYAVFRDVYWHGVMSHLWLPENVVPYLPTWEDAQGNIMLDDTNDTVKSTKAIRQDLLEFFHPNPSWPRDTELWAYVAAYDHVALAQTLGGPMVGLAGTGMPFYTHDLASIRDLFLPWDFEWPVWPKAGNQHHALDDALELKRRWEFIQDGYDIFTP